MRATLSPSARGRPLIVLALVMSGWIGMRFAFWPQETLQALERAVPAAILAEGEPRRPSIVTAAKAGMPPAAWSRPAHGAAFPPSPFVPHPGIAPEAGGAAFGALDEAASHDLLWIAAVTRGAYAFPAPGIASDIGRARVLSQRSGLASDRRASQPDRWSLDGWLLWRPDGRGSAAVAPASYGASQAGVLLSYRLAPGSRFAPRAYARATGFADGRLTFRKALASGGGFRLAAGGGVWGGAQQGAARVDVGPSAAMTLATGQLTARVEADYRIRVAGDAAPGSGPALTISASF